MDMHGLVLGVDVRDSVFYDQLTGEEKPAYTLVLEVVDMGVKARPKHTCQIQEGYPLVDELKELKKKKAPPAELEMLANELKAQAAQLELQQVQLEVQQVRANSGFSKLICRLVS
jgi:pyruvate/oxaloacetate carboxyltransferase